MATVTEPVTSQELMQQYFDYCAETGELQGASSFAYWDEFVNTGEKFIDYERADRDGRRAHILRQAQAILAAYRDVPDCPRIVGGGRSIWDLVTGEKRGFIRAKDYDDRAVDYLLHRLEAEIGRLVGDLYALENFPLAETRKKVQTAYEGAEKKAYAKAEKYRQENVV